MPLIREQLSLGKTIKFTPDGTSMLPMLRPKRDSVVLAAISGKLKKYDILLYQRDNGQFVLHRIVKVGETYTAVGDNHLQLEKEIRHEQMIAVVVSFTRNGKMHSVDELQYRMYCRLWHYTRPIRRVLYGCKNIFRRKP